nr:hypothetical protein [Cellulomonas sp. JZ18]
MTAASVVAPPSASSPAAATSAPATAHGTRRPHRPRVRSLSAPTSGCAAMVHANDTVLTRARLPTFAAGSSAATCAGSSTATTAP